MSGATGVEAQSAKSRNTPEFKVDCRAESRLRVVCTAGEVEVIVELVPEYGFEIKVGDKTARRSTLDSIELADWLEKRGVQDPKSLIREVKLTLQKAAAKAKIACTTKERIPPIIECRVDDTVFIFKRYSGKWIVKPPMGQSEMLDSLSADELLHLAERHNFDVETLLQALDKVLGRGGALGASPWRLVYFNPIQDYVSGLGPVLGALYVPASENKVTLAYLYVTGGALQIGDVEIPIRDDDAAVVYTAKQVEIELEDPGFPYLDEILTAWRESFTIRDLVKQAESFIASRLTASEVDLKYMAIHTVAQYFRDLVVTFPALDIAKSGYGGGGTTALKILLALSPRPSYTIEPSPAYIYRLADVKKPTMGIDENTAKLSEEVRRAYAQLYIAAFDKNVGVGRADEGGKMLRAFRPRCNLIVVDPQALFGDLAFTRRAPEVVLTPDPRRRENPDLDALLMDSEVRQLRGRLYTAFLKYADAVKEEVERIYRELPCPGTALQVFALHLAIARLVGPEYVNAVAKKMMDWYKAVEVAQVEGDPTKRVLKEIYKAVVELETFVKGVSVGADWPTAPNWDKDDVPDPWDFEWSGRSGEPVKFIAPFKELRNWISDQIGTVIKVDEKVIKKERVSKRYWRAPDDAETRELLTNPYAFAALLRRYLQPFIIELPNREKALKVETAEDLVRLKEAVSRALTVASGLEHCLEALSVRLSATADATPTANSLQISASRLQPSATPSADGGKVAEGEGVGGGVGEIQTSAEPTAAPLATAGGEKPGGKEGGTSAVADEEEKARKELEIFIRGHLPEGPAAHAEQQNVQPTQHGGVEKKTKEEILSEFEEFAKKYGEF